MSSILIFMGKPFKKRGKVRKFKFFKYKITEKLKKCCQRKRKKQKETLENKLVSKRSNIIVEENSSDKENRLDKLHQEIKRLKDLVNKKEEISLKSKEKEETNLNN